MLGPQPKSASQRPDMGEPMAIVATSFRSTTTLILARVAFVALISALIVLVNITFEWTYPYCNILGDGPAKPAYGFPLPFLQDNVAFSLSWNIMLASFLLNVVLLAALAYPLMGWGVRWLSKAGRIASVLIAVPALLAAFTVGLGIIAFDFRIVSSITPYGDTYWDYRPIGIQFDRKYYDCTPSEYWFGPIKNPALMPKIPS